MPNIIQKIKSIFSKKKKYLNGNQFIDFYISRIFLIPIIVQNWLLEMHILKIIKILLTQKYQKQNFYNIPKNIKWKKYYYTFL